MSNETNRVVIVAAMDRTPASESVVSTATALAGTLPNAEIHVLHVIAGGGITDTSASMKAHLEEGQSFVARVLDQVSAHFAGTVTGHVAMGAPRQQILQLASDLSADLIVVGAHQKSAVGRWLLGSVSQAVVSDAPCTVLVARPKDRSGVPDIAPPCSRCLETQQASRGATLWCAEHTRRHAHGKVHHGRDIESLGGSSVFIRT